MKAVQATGYPLRTLYLSTARGQSAPAELVKGMGAKSGARGITGPFRHVGVGVAADADGAPVWVVLLAAPQ